MDTVSVCLLQHNTPTFPSFIWHGHLVLWGTHKRHTQTFLWWSTLPWEFWGGTLNSVTMSKHIYTCYSNPCTHIRGLRCAITDEQSVDVCKASPSITVGCRGVGCWATSPCECYQGTRGQHIIMWIMTFTFCNAGLINAHKCMLQHVHCTLMYSTAATHAHQNWLDQA